MLFQRKPFVVMTALAYAIQPHMQRITEAVDQALQTAEAFRAINDVPCLPPVTPRNLINVPDISELQQQSIR